MSRLLARRLHSSTGTDDRTQSPRAGPMDSGGPSGGGDSAVGHWDLASAQLFGRPRADHPHSISTIEGRHRVPVATYASTWCFTGIIGFTGLAAPLGQSFCHAGVSSPDVDDRCEPEKSCGPWLPHRMSSTRRTTRESSCSEENTNMRRTMATAAGARRKGRALPEESRKGMQLKESIRPSTDGLGPFPRFSST